MKLMLLGIAFILFGISISAMIMAEYYIFNITEIIGRILPVIGMVLVIVGFFSKDKQEK